MHPLHRIIRDGQKRILTKSDLSRTAKVLPVLSKESDSIAAAGSVAAVALNDGSDQTSRKRYLVVQRLM